MMINVGNGAYINADKIDLITPPNSNPVRSTIARARDKNELHDVTAGKRTKSVIILEDGVVLSTVVPETLAKRINGDRKCSED